MLSSDLVKTLPCKTVLDEGMVGSVVVIFRVCEGGELVARQYGGKVYGVTGIRWSAGQSQVVFVLIRI
jgi:hypothetical protein